MYVYRANTHTRRQLICCIEINQQIDSDRTERECERERKQKCNWFQVQRTNCMCRAGDKGSSICRSQSVDTVVIVVVVVVGLIVNCKPPATKLKMVNLFCLNIT